MKRMVSELRVDPIPDEQERENKMEISEEENGQCGARRLDTC